MSDAAPTLMSALGLVRVIERANGRAVIEFEVAPHMCHTGGVAQGGFVCGWIDDAMATASFSQDADMAPMTLEVKISYFAPVRPGRVIAEGWVERRGRTICFAEGRLLDLEGKVLAKGSSTVRLMPRTAVEASAKRALG